MPALKAKPVRLIDLLYTMAETDFIVVTTNNGRNSYSNTVTIIEAQFKNELGKEIKGLKVNGGTLQVFI